MSSTPSFQARLLQELQPLRSEGLRNLCAILRWEHPQLQVAYDNLAGETVSDKTLALILHLERFERFDSWTCLRRILEEHFPDRDASFFPPVPSPSPLGHATAKAATTNQSQAIPPKSFIGIEWVEIPEGEFWLGDDTGRDEEMPCHLVELPTYWIAKTPLTNAQYRAFVQATGHPAPSHWENGQIPQGKGNHPVVDVSWDDGMALAKWASEQMGQRISLPSEAEWEKTARGGLFLPNTEGEWEENIMPKRKFPWIELIQLSGRKSYITTSRFGNNKCNTKDAGIADTTPVDKYLQSASPYGVLEMSGNVWEWTRSLYKSYPYIARDGRENPDNDEALRVFRGGSWRYSDDGARVMARGYSHPANLYDDVGLRLVCVPHPAIS